MRAGGANPGDMQTTLDLTQLWIEEREILAERAALVPDNGVIVEIGTAQGGSGLIFHAAVGHRGAKIYSFDIAPSPEAYENLKNTTATIVAKSSVDGALQWKQMGRKPIDLLFIDGSHALQHVFEDFNSWAPFLRPGGEIVFHDYDPIERGGLVHLGVRVCVDTVLRCGFLDRPFHQYRLLYGTVMPTDRIQVKAKECYETFGELGRRIVRLIDTDYSGWTCVGGRRFAELLSGCLNVGTKMAVISPEEAGAKDGTFLVFARPLERALALMWERGILQDSVMAVNNLQACYILAHALERNRDYLLSLTSSRKEFFRWEEILFMFEHAFGRSDFPGNVGSATAARDLDELSRVVAREQVRLTLLAQLLRTFVDWTP